ncbi:hypothetical protein DVH24_020749 [Malus domestica]|uniref:Retrotransposon gag domain-containing protein n=1 Tax=Malus domestica TaxID=3750 RepID=A0A498J9A0_MALDO|nr:hypothetical protein DVH24_020749 [Malus domestica]
MPPPSNSITKITNYGWPKLFIPYVLGTIAHQYRTARETWQALENLFASSSLKHITQLRSDLLHTTRNGRRIGEFLSIVNDSSHKLALVGSPVPETEIIDVITKNVGSPYKNIVISAAQVRDKPFTYDGLEALLLSAEVQIDQRIGCECFCNLLVIIIVVVVSFYQIHTIANVFTKGLSARLQASCRWTPGRIHKTYRLAVVLFVCWGVGCFLLVDKSGQI